MKTLVIHPDDRSTDFLTQIYDGKGYTVLTDRHIGLEQFIDEMNKHDRVMMLGHGYPYGLLGYTEIFMNPKFIDVLRTKECVCIWCNADMYVEKIGLKGFYSGMFISEVGEARYFGITIGQEQVTYSNELFGQLMREMVESPNVLQEIKKSYVGECPVIKFNNDRLYYKTDNKPIRKIIVEDLTLF